MKPRQNSPKPQSDLFRQPLVNLLDLRHELCKLSELIDWQRLHDEFAPLYGEDGRPGESIRLMGGLQINSGGNAARRRGVSLSSVVGVLSLGSAAVCISSSSSCNSN